METCDIQGCRVGIAIVEDEKDLVEVFKRLFTKRGIQICFIAYDGYEAVQRFRECTPKPHIILMDYRLPVMHGIDAMREIKKIYPNVMIIFLSADVSHVKDAMQAGAFIFLKKPVSIHVIIDAIGKAFKSIPA